MTYINVNRRFIVPGAEYHACSAESSRNINIFRVVRSHESCLGHSSGSSNFYKTRRCACPPFVHPITAARLWVFAQSATGR